MYVDELNHFIRCIQNKKQTINPVKKGLETLSLAITMKNKGKWRK